MHILVVDDHLPNVRMLQELLAGRYRVSVAHSGIEALGAMRELIGTSDKPDLVLLDMQMVGMQGWQVLSQWRAAEDSAGVPVIFLVNKIDSDTERRAYQAGVVDCIRKPFALPVVLAKVEQHLLLSKQQLYIEHQLRERTAQLSDALQQTRQQHQAHSQDFAGMSQVLRSPINAILGLSHLLSSKNPPPRRPTSWAKSSTPRTSCCAWSTTCSTCLKWKLGVCRCSMCPSTRKSCWTTCIALCCPRPSAKA